MITLTSTAAAKISRVIAQRGQGLGLRVGVKTTGCSGLAYVLEYIDIANPEDIIYNTHDINLYVDPKSNSYLAGLTIDFRRNGLNEGFEFVNPNERDRCGCGESFRL
jgi:iron-sulfur cluster assembly protein